MSTVFSRAERGLGSTSLGIPDIVARTKGNPQQIMQLVMGGQINITQGLLAKRLADSVAMEARQGQAQPPTVLEEAFPQLGQQPMGQQMAPQGGPQPPAGAPVDAPTAMPQDPAAQQAPQAPQEMPMGMAEGGLMQLDFAAPEYAGGGLVAFADGESVLGPWFEELATKAVPGINTTSRRRTPERNKQVGGAPNSWHLTDNARDFVPPKGMSMGQLAAKLRETYGPGYRVINEGNHVHVQPASGRGGGKSSRSSSESSTGGLGGTDVAKLSPIPSELTEATPLDFEGAQEAVRSQLPVRTADREALRAKLGEAEDPSKTRRRDTFSGLAEALGNLRPGTTPLEGLIQGFAATGKSLTAGELKREERDIQRMERLVGLEDAQNKLERDIFELSNMRAKMEQEGVDQGKLRQLDLLIKEREMQFRANEQALTRSFQASEGDKDRATTREVAEVRSTARDEEFRQAMVSTYNNMRSVEEGALRATTDGRKLEMSDPAAFRKAVSERVAQQAQAQFGQVNPSYAQGIAAMALGSSSAAGGAAEDPLGLRR